MIKFRIYRDDYNTTPFIIAHLKFVPWFTFYFIRIGKMKWVDIGQYDSFESAKKMLYHYSNKSKNQTVVSGDLPVTYWI